MHRQMPSSSRSEDKAERLPELVVFDGGDDGYLDADEGYARWARRHYKGGLDTWIYGGECPIKPGMTQAEIERICDLIGALRRLSSLSL